MDDKLKKFLRQASPLIAVQVVLAIINIFVIAISGSFVPWAMIPIAAMAIPEFVMFANAFLNEEVGEDPAAAASKLKRFIRQTSALFGTQFLLAMINLFTILVSDGPQSLWSLIPIAAIGIPEFIILANTFLSDNHSSDRVNDSEDTSDTESSEGLQSDAARREAKRAAREFTRQAKRTAREIRKGTLQSYGPAVNTSGAALADATQVSATATPASQFDFNVETDLAQARRYKQQIEALIKANPNKSTRLADVSTQVNEWVKIVEAMAARITDFRRNTLIQNDLTAVPKAISKLQGQVAEETDERVKSRLQQTLATRQNQLATLEKLQSTMRQAEIQLESTVASLGTIYSQVLTAQSTNQVADYSHLAANVSEQVQQLQDQIEALEEVKLGGNLGG